MIYERNRKADRTRSSANGSQSEGRATFTVRQRALIFAAILFIFFYCVNRIQSLRTTMIKEELLKVSNNATGLQNGNLLDKATLVTHKTPNEKPLHHGSHYIHKVVMKKRALKFQRRSGSDKLRKITS